MTWSCGLVGLPNAGKSTVFNALTRGEAATGSYPFTTVHPNRGTMPVPDPRPRHLMALAGSRRAAGAALELLDIAGLVRGASRGEGLGNQFLAHIREVDAVIHVLRCFAAPAVSHPMGSLDPVRDLEVVATELALADLQAIHRRKERVGTPARLGDPGAREEMERLERVEAALDQGLLPATVESGAAGHAYLQRELFLLTAKPGIYLANIGEDDPPEPEGWPRLRQRAQADGVPLVPFRGRLEADLAELEPGEREVFARSWGGEGPGAVIAALLSVLNLVTFLTCNVNAARAWLVPAGTPAAAAAGKIHSDMERGFIRAEVIPFAALAAAGSLAAAREQGLARVEGRDYPVTDGDVIHFRFRPPA